MTRSAKTFVATDFALFERENVEHLRALRENESGRVFELGETLRRHAIDTQPAWPTAEDRQRDYEDHLQLLTLLERVPRRR